jgi:hypothetical protein
VAICQAQAREDEEGEEEEGGKAVLGREEDEEDEDEDEEWMERKEKVTHAAKKIRNENNSDKKSIRLTRTDSASQHSLARNNSVHQIYHVPGSPCTLLFPLLLPRFCCFSLACFFLILTPFTLFFPSLFKSTSDGP